MIPKGYVSLADAINRVGERKYGEGAWLGGGAVKLNRELRPRDLTELEHRKTAVGQWLEVTEIMRREFVGTPQDHADAVPVRLQSDGDNNSYPIPPQIWLDDIQASKMFNSGEAAFWPGKYPKLFNGGWSPTAAPLSGRILIPEASLPLLINGMALLAQPTGTVFQEGKTEPPAERGVSETPPEPNVTEGSDANLNGTPGGKTGSGAIDDPHALEEARLPTGSDTGAPGRPSKGIHLCENEFRIRVASNACESTLHAEAEHLLKWFRTEHPGKGPVQCGSIENRIRREYWAWKNRDEDEPTKLDEDKPTKLSAE